MANLDYEAINRAKDVRTVARVFHELLEMTTDPVIKLKHRAFEAGFLWELYRQTGLAFNSTTEDYGFSRFANERLSIIQFPESRDQWLVVDFGLKEKQKSLFVWSDMMKWFLEGAEPMLRFTNAGQQVGLGSGSAIRREMTGVWIDEAKHLK